MSVIDILTNLFLSDKTPADTTQVSNNSIDPNVGLLPVIQTVILIVIIIILICMVVLLIVIWVDTNETRKQNIKDTFSIIFGNNMLGSIIFLSSLYIVIPIIFSLSSTFTNVVLPAIQSGIISGTAAPIQKNISKFLKKVL